MSFDHTASPAPTGQLTRTQRLDRLPFTRAHGKLLVGSGIGWALDAMDVGLISFVMLALAHQWQLDAPTLGWIGAIGFVGMALGASLGGLLADRIGRRQVFAVTLLVYGIATGASANNSTGFSADSSMANRSGHNAAQAPQPLQHTGLTA